MSPIHTTASPAAAYEPHWFSRSAFQAVVTLFFLVEVLLALVLRGGASLLLTVPLVLVLSHLMHGAAIGFHEASHGLLRQNRRFNEFDGILLGAFSLMSFSLYRAAHQSHHAHLATERDEELWPFVVTRAPRWARQLSAFCELTLGLFYTPFLFLRTFLRSGSPIRNRRLRRRIWIELVLMLVVWTVVLIAVAHWNAWRFFIWMYLVPAFIAANLQSWRKYIEHVGMTGSTVNSSTRNIVSQGWLGRIVAFTLLHEPFHGVHHLHAGMPHPELPGHVSELRPSIPEEKAPFRSYGHALLDLLRSLADPRVGAHWRRATPIQR
jgi:fatty acid desaturase